jgi:beta-barrel assembly-enhancing protease
VGAIYLAMMGLCGSVYADDVHQDTSFQVPEIGTGVGFLDQYKERMIGEGVLREVNRMMPVLRNPWLEDQLFYRFSSILSQTKLGEPIGLVVIKDAQINAFAVPGGLFALNTGLISSARNMDEVAGVMAHEIAHVTQRHYSRSTDAFKGQGLLALAGIVVGAVVASQANGDVGTAVILGTQAAMMDKQLTYSRNQEREADRVGMQFMYSAGFNPHGMADFFEVMHRSTHRLSYLPDFWLTHPLTTERMSEARLRANQLPEIKSKLQDEDFEILKWYGKVLSQQATEAELMVLLQRQPYVGQLTLAAYYIEKSDYAAAEQYLNQAKQTRRLNSLQTLLQTDLYLAQNKISAAQKIIEPAFRVMPENRALAYKYAEVLNRLGKVEQVQSIVDPFLQRNRRDVQGWSILWQSMSLAQPSNTKAINVLRYRAEMEFWSGDEEGAIKSMLHAQRLATKNASLLAKIKQRTQEMQHDRQFKV